MLYSLDDKYVVSGSDDTNIRFWKSEASTPVKFLNPREKEALGYRRKLIEKYKYNPEVKRITRKKNLPKYVLNRKKVRQIQNESRFRKRKNVEMNSKFGGLEYNSEKISKIVNSGTISK